MAKEFGIEFMTKHKSGFNGEFFFRAFGDLWVNNVNIDSDDGSLRLIDIINCKDENRTRFNDKIYAIEESESIFEPLQGDIGIERNLHSIETCYFGGRYWAYENEELQTKPHQQRVKIIYRDGREFFMPEVEND